VREGSQVGELGKASVQGGNVRAIDLAGTSQRYEGSRRSTNAPCRT